MNGIVIPAPVRFDSRPGGFSFRPGTTVACTDSAAAPAVGRFCSEVTRRTGVRLTPAIGCPVPDQPSVMVELGPGDDLGGLPSPIGVSPDGDTRADERYAITIGADEVAVRAIDPVGAARGLTTLIQLIATAPPGEHRTVFVPGARILDAPRYAWRGLSLDLARTFFTVAEIRRVIDLLALYKLNVLHLHLNDDQSWRLPMAQPSRVPESGAAWYSGEDLRALAAYGVDRNVTLVPEIDTPGHASALLRLCPDLRTGRNDVDVELMPGRKRRARWLDPALPATFELIERVLAGLASAFPGPYIHIGGDEPHGMPHDLYAAYVTRMRHLVRSIGKRPLGWQESARAGLGPDDIIQYWLAGIEPSGSLSPQARAQLSADLAMSRHDVQTAVAASAAVIMSPLGSCYLDVPYAEASADAEQAARQGSVGLRAYPPRTIAESFGWEPSEAAGPGLPVRVAGVEAAIWGETIAGFDDLSFLLLPRLAGVAHKAWSDPRVSSWADHRDRLARHGSLWDHDQLTYFRSCAVDWL